MSTLRANQWQTTSGSVNFGIVQAQMFPALTTRDLSITTSRPTWTTVRTSIITPRSVNNTIVFTAKWLVYVIGVTNTVALSFRILRSDGVVVNSSDDFISPAGNSTAKGENSHDPYVTTAGNGFMLTGGALRFDRPNTTNPVTYLWQFTNEDATRNSLQLGHNANYNCWGMIQEYQGLPT
jgi:hypothetical protein